MLRGLALRRSLLKVAVMGLILVLASVIAVLSRTSDRAAAATFGPVAEYSFDEDPGEGTAVEDLSGNGHTATIHGAKWTPHGRYGGAMEFNEHEETYLSVPDSPELDLTEEFTLEAWVRPEEGRRWQPIIDKQIGDGEGYERDAWWLYAAGPEPQRPWGGTEHAAGGGHEVAASDPLAPEVWSHVALTFDGAVERLYVDGVLVDSGPAEAPLETEGEVEIGGATETGDFLFGRLDELRIYERVLDQPEVAADMETPIETPKQTPVAEYSFDEGEEAGASVEDLAGENDGTIEGAERTTHGRYGGGMEFGGEPDCVTVPDSASLQLGEEFTVEAWVRPDALFHGPIISKAAELTPSYELAIGSTGNGLVQGWAGGYDEYAETEVHSAQKLEPHVWTHLALTYDGAYLRLYVDGQLAGSSTHAEFVLESGGPLTIGCSTVEGQWFEGRIDEVRLYERALDGAEVGADMEAPIQTPKAGPVAAYSFDEGEIATEGGTAEDVSGNGHTATLEGGAVRARGRYGDSLSFHDGEDCATVPDSPELRLSEEFTLEAWVWAEGGLYEDPVVVREAGGEGVFGIGIGSREEGEAEGFIGEGEGSKAAVGGGELVREHTWVHIATTYDGARLRLYVDGELVATKAATTPPLTGEGSLRIGCDGPDGPFGGRIDEVRLYGRALNGPEVDSDMESPLQTPQQTPVASYSFDEKNEETAADITGDGHTATVEGAKWTEHGRYGGAMEFNAAEEDVLKITASEELNFDEEFTLEAWVRPSGEDNHHAPLIDKQEGSGHGYFLYEGGSVSDRPSGAANEEQEFIHAGEPLPADTWSHVALTFSGNRTYLYVNGELVDNGAAAPTVTSEGELEIGGSTDTGDWFDGRIDEVRIYNRALEPAEVDGDMEAPIQTPKQGPIAAWSFDEGGGTTIEDITGDGHEGTIEGAEWARGKYGDALKFNGENDVVKVPNSPEFALTEGFTLESWVRPESASNEWAPILAKEIGGGKAANELAWWLYEGGSDSNVPFGGNGPTAGKEELASAEDPLPIDAWSHLALTYDGSQIRLYVDGELVDCSDVPAHAPPVTGGELQIGAATEHGDYYKGRIDEIRIYNRALSGSEVSASLGALPRPLSEESESESTEAVLVGSINPMGTPTSYRFEYGPTSSYGRSVPDSWDETERWVQGNEPEEVDQAIDELEPETTYHYRIVARNALGTIVGRDKTFTTSAAEPTPLAMTSFEGDVGVNWSGISTTDSEMNLIDESGAKMFRVVVYPGCPTIEGDVKRQQNHNDNLFLTLAQDHITILPDVSGIPCRGGKNQLPKIEKGSGALSRWEAGLKRLAERYGPEGEFWESHTALQPYAPKYWEIWNEENVERNAADTGQIIPKRYGRLLEVSHDALKEVDGKIKVVFGGLLTIGGTNLKAPKNKRKEEREMTIRRFIKEAGHTNDYEAVSLHPYAFLGSVTGVTHDVKLNIQAARFSVNRFGGGKGKEIWVTEIGWPVEGSTEPDEVHQSVSPVVQEERLNSVLDKIKAYSGKYNIGNIFWYNIQDVSGSSWEAHCGLVEQDGGKRPSFAAFQAQAK
jgi:hypothetical protein